MNQDLSNLETYNYSLPKELIAQYPCDVRDKSRLLYYEQKTKNISHKHFTNLTDYLNENDILVLNNTKVVPARFFVLEKESLGNPNDRKPIEIVLVRSISSNNLTWLVIAGPQKRLRKTNTVIVQTNNLNLSTFIELDVINHETIKFRSSNDLSFILNKAGQLALPHYIERERKDIDINRYQTVFAEIEGAIAAPTAALHFTEKLLEELKKKNVEIVYITLHVGPGTFMPIRTNNINDHNLMAEEYFVDKNTWGKIASGKKSGKRIIGCGTTVVRTLEHISNIADSTFEKDFHGLCDLYITPGYKFNIIDGMITNFHLPKTSLLLLVSALIGWENLKNIYDEAIKENYRFYSYGDATLLL